jgi:hypothetical protein
VLDGAFSLPDIHDEHVWANVESIAKTLGILVAGWWTYFHFIRQRQSYPRAALSLRCADRVLPDQRRLLQVFLDIQNPGNTIVHVRDVDVRIQLVAPLTSAQLEKLAHGREALAATADSQIPWFLVGRRRLAFEPGQMEIEPGENEFIHCDFILPDRADLLRVYANVRNLRKRLRRHRFWWAKRDIGWQQVTYHEITRAPAAGAHPERPETPAREAPVSEFPRTDPAPDSGPIIQRFPEPAPPPVPDFTKYEQTVPEGVPDVLPDEGGIPPAARHAPSQSSRILGI